jgi:molybdopterin/thiamine biosynthesis adenylyltransferase
MNKNKIMIIGCGGIGSYLISLLDRANRMGETKKMLYDITVYDPDVVETKNLSYQNFDKDHIGLSKPEALAQNYKFNAQPYKVLTPSQIQGYDLVICCADNLDVRKMLYKSEVRWLDLRAQGRAGLLVSSDEDPKLYTTLTTGPDGSFSCQGDNWDRSNQGVHFTHVAVAGYGAQWVQRFFSGDYTPKHIVVSA